MGRGGISDMYKHISSCHLPVPVYRYDCRGDGPGSGEAACPTIVPRRLCLNPPTVTSTPALPAFCHLINAPIHFVPLHLCTCYHYHPLPKPHSAAHSPPQRHPQSTHALPSLPIITLSFASSLNPRPCDPERIYGEANPKEEQKNLCVRTHSRTRQEKGATASLRGW